MKKRGFTLIELLAVIVILAIIALIATPIIMNTISNSKKGAAERSTERYFNAVETMIATERLDNKIVEDGDYEVQTNGNLCLSGETCNLETQLKVEMNGNKPNTGIVTIENGQVVRNKLTTVSIGEYTVSYDSDSKIVATSGSSTLEEIQKIRGKAVALRNAENYIAHINSLNLPLGGYYVYEDIIDHPHDLAESIALDYDGVLPNGECVGLSNCNSIALENGKVVRSTHDEVDGEEFDFSTSLVFGDYVVSYNSNNELEAIYSGVEYCTLISNNVSNPYALGTVYNCPYYEVPADLYATSEFRVLKEEEDYVWVFGEFAFEYAVGSSFNQMGYFLELASYTEGDLFLEVDVPSKQLIESIDGGNGLSTLTWLQGDYWTSTPAECPEGAIDCGYYVNNDRIDIGVYYADNPDLGRADHGWRAIIKISKDKLLTD